MRSTRTHEDYILVTKEPKFRYYYIGSLTPDEAKTVANEFQAEEDKTFWLVSKDGEFIRRYSVESAPKWVMNIYYILKQDRNED